MKYFEILDLDTLEDEKWVDCKGLEGEYKVSNLGRIKSVTRYITTKNGQRRKISGKIIKQQPRYKHGRPTDLAFTVRKQTYRVNQMVYNSFKKYVIFKDNECIMRKNKIPWDNRLVNLVKTTRQHSNKVDHEKCLISYLSAKKNLKKATKIRQRIANAPIKECSKCGKEKASKEFGKGRRQCKSCLTIIERERKKKKKKNTLSESHISNSVGGKP